MQNLYKLVFQIYTLIFISLSFHKTWMRASGPRILKGGCYKPVPLDCFLAQVKVFEAKSNTAQVAVLTQILSTQHIQLQLPLLQSLLAVTTVHQLWIKKTTTVKPLKQQHIEHRAYFFQHFKVCGLYCKHRNQSK